MTRSEELFETRGDIVQIVSNGVPQSVRLVNTPSGHRESGTNLGVYVQDSWTFKRLTVNGGVRYQYFNVSINAMEVEPGRFVGFRSYPEQANVPNWRGDRVLAGSALFQRVKHRA